MDNKRTLIATLISPMSSLVVLVAVAIEAAFHEGHKVDSSGSFMGLLVVLLMFVIGVLSVSYLLTIFVGLPTHYVLSKFNINMWFVYLVSGVVIGVGYDVWSTPSNMPEQLRSAGLWVCGGGGAIIATVFWYLAVKPHNNTP